MVALLASRLAHYLSFQKNETLPVSFAYNWLVWTTLAGALHWGIVGYWVLSHEAYASLQNYMIISIAVFGLAGTTALSISDQIRTLFPLFFMGPPALALLIRGDEQDLTLAAMGMLAIAYVLVTARTSSRDYWHAIRNRELAEQRARQMEQLSITDQLTGLKNRSFFDKRFRSEWKRNDRQRSPLSLLMLDLDHFKQLNDTYGHAFGDHCLQQVGEVLESKLHRETDLASRYGGEEFIILLPDTDASAAAVIAERLRMAVSNLELTFDQTAIRITCSIGGATTFPDFHDQRDQLLKQADDALYKAKGDGRDQYQAYNALDFGSAQSV